MTETLSTDNASASRCARRPSASFRRVSTVAMRRTFPSSCLDSMLFFKTMSSAWSHGTSSKTIVRLPRTSGSSTTFNPLISWISRKKSFRSTSFRFTETGSPVYFGPDDACCERVFCSAARFTAGSIAFGADWLPVEAALPCAIAPFATGNRFPSGRSTNFDAAPVARSVGSTVSAFFCV